MTVSIDAIVEKARLVIDNTQKRHKAAHDAPFSYDLKNNAYIWNMNPAYRKAHTN